MKSVYFSLAIALCLCYVSASVSDVEFSRALEQSKRLEKQLQQQEVLIQRLVVEHEAQEAQNRKLTAQVRHLEQHVTSDPEEQNDYSGSGCLLDVITLVCPDDKGINITDAVYGFFQNCSENQCCEPQEGDCTGSVEDNRLSDWLTLLAQCQNQTTCDFTYLGTAVAACSEFDSADYMDISYQCLPEDAASGPAIAFSATPSITRNYDGGDTILFDAEILNVGGGYDAASSNFTCPVTGVYVFHVSVYSQVDLKINAAIMLSSTGRLVNAFVDNTDSEIVGNQSSNMVIVTCEAGQSVHVQAEEGDGQNLFVGYPFPAFSGYYVGVAPV